LKGESDAANRKTPAKWEGVLADLAAKRQGARHHAERLRTEKQNMALEAAMGGGDARKRLKEIKAELARLTLEADNWESAIAQAETEKGRAEESAASEQERQRQKELSTLAATAVEHARDSTKALEEAVKADAAVKATIRDMMVHANNQEAPGVDRLLQPGIYMRGAEHAGLRSHLEFAAYTGDRSHIVPLEEALALILGRWQKGVTLMPQILNDLEVSEVSLVDHPCCAEIDPKTGRKV
jgi:hypothetical protein